MADGDRGVLVQQQHGGWFAYQIAAAHHHRVFPCNGDAAALQNLDDSRRGAGRQRRPARLQAARVYRVEAVHVLGRGDGIEQGFRIDVGGQRQLDENAVNLVAGVEAGHEAEHLFGGDGFGRGDEVARNAQIGAGLHLAADINLRRRHMAHQHRRQPRPYALGCQQLHLFGHFLLDCRGNRGAIENLWHSSLHRTIVSSPA